MTPDLEPPAPVVKAMTKKDADWSHDAKVLAAYAGFIRGATNEKHAAVDALSGLLSLMGEERSTGAVSRKIGNLKGSGRGATVDTALGAHLEAHPEELKAEAARIISNIPQGPGLRSLVEAFLNGPDVLLSAKEAAAEAKATTYRRGTVYRFFSQDGALLYIGSTGPSYERFRGHERTQPWWTDVASVTIEHHATREEASIAEMKAIGTEHPRHNKVGVVRPEGTGAVIESAAPLPPG